MTQPEDYDVVILGDGTGSTLAAWTFAAEGKRVAVIERRYIGGSCPNIACLPSKNIIHSAKVASYSAAARCQPACSKARTASGSKVVFITAFDRWQGAPIADHLVLI